MADNKWLAVTALSFSLSLTACPAGDGGDEAIPSDEEGDPGDDDDDDDDELDNDQAQCGERLTADASDEELAINRRADLDVATALLAELGGDEANVLLSPYSLRTAFGQVYGGSQGASREEIEQVLGFTELGDRTHDVLNTVTQALESRNAEETESSPELVVRPINRSFLDTGYESAVNDDWLTLMQESYGACLEVFDMNVDQPATLEHVNGWVSDQTRGLIPNLVKSLPDYVALIVVNALYFKASWQTPFEEGLTTDAAFATWSGGSAQVDMMRAPFNEGQYGAGEGWQAVTIPYSDWRLDMLVILPDAGTEATFEAGLDGGVLEDVFDSLQPTTVDLSMPKFDLKSTWSLRSALESLGMPSAFVNAQDFDPIAQGMEPIYQVFHDVAIIIDEKGTEAAAATAVVFGEDGGEDPVAEATVVVDHTFYLAIRDREAGAVMFFARIGDPSDG